MTVNKNRKSYEWNPENLKTLIDNSGYTIGSISKTVGLREATLSQYLRGNDPPVPSLRLLVALADFFAVPTDFLLGRCSREEAESLLKDYKYAYNALRREEYEDIFLKRKIFDDILDGFYAPYPYNLLDDIFKSFDHLVTEDEMNGLNALLSQFDSRTQHILDMRYQQEMTLEQIGNYYHLSRDRIRQIQAKAIRMLRHPSRKNRILYGETGFKKKQELEEWSLALNRKEEELARLAEQLEQTRKELGREFETVEIPEVESEYDKPKNERVMSWGTYYDPSDAFEDLNLSVRSWNCLRRANVSCVSEILDHLEKGDLLQIRNLGVASMNEIMAKIAEQRNGHFDPIPGLTYGYRLVLNAA